MYHRRLGRARSGGLNHTIKMNDAFLPVLGSSSVHVSDTSSGRCYADVQSHAHATAEPSKTHTQQARYNATDQEAALAAGSSNSHRTGTRRLGPGSRPSVWHTHTISRARGSALLALEEIRGWMAGLYDYKYNVKTLYGPKIRI